MTEQMPSQDDLIARARTMPWKVLIRLMMTAAEHHHAKEMPQIVIDWFELNRKDPDPAELDAFVLRAEQYAAISGTAIGGDRAERAPIGPWWIEVQPYLRDGKRWWLLRAYHENRGNLMEAPKQDLRRLHKIVDYAGGSAKRAIDCGPTAIWTWKA